MSGTWRGVPGNSRDHLGVLPRSLRTLAQSRHRGRCRGERRRGVHTPRGAAAPRALPLRRCGADRHLHLERSAAVAGIFIRRHKVSAPPRLRPRTYTEPEPMGRRRSSVLIQGNPREGGVSRRVEAAVRGLAALAEKWRERIKGEARTCMHGRASSTGDNVFNTASNEIRPRCFRIKATNPSRAPGNPSQGAPTIAQARHGGRPQVHCKIPSSTPRS